MGASLGLRQGPKRAQASSAGVVLSLPGRDGNKLLQSHRGCAQGERSSAKGPPHPQPGHPRVSARVLRLLSLTSATCGPLGTPGPSFTPPSLGSVRKGNIGAVTERLREWAVCGHHIGAGNGGGGEILVDPPAPVSKSAWLNPRLLRG